MRWYRSDRLDELETPEEPYRNDRLRELVDSLPAHQKHMVERVFFGQVSVAKAASEIPMSAGSAKIHLEKGLAALREALLEED